MITLAKKQKNPKMVRGYWKVLAIIFMIYALLNISINVYDYYSYENYLEKEKTCAYDFCSESLEYIYEDDLCECYDLDLIGNYVLTKKTYLK